jgi:hypothetical protein
LQQVEHAASGRADMLELGDMIGEDPELTSVEQYAAAIGLRVGFNDDEAVAAREGEAAEEHRIQHCKTRRREPDAGCERER